MISRAIIYAKRHLWELLAVAVFFLGFGVALHDGFVEIAKTGNPLRIHGLYIGLVGMALGFIVLLWRKSQSSNTIS